MFSQTDTAVSSTNHELTLCLYIIIASILTGIYFNIISFLKLLCRRPMVFSETDNPVFFMNELSWYYKSWLGRSITDASAFKIRREIVGFVKKQSLRIYSPSVTRLNWNILDCDALHSFTQFAYSLANNINNIHFK